MGAHTPHSGNSLTRPAPPPPHTHTTRQRPWSLHGANTGGFYRCKFYQDERSSLLEYEKYTAKERSRLKVTAKDQVTLAAEYTKLHTKAQVKVSGVVRHGSGCPVCMGAQRADLSRARLPAVRTAARRDRSTEHTRTRFAA